jgi:hypothetical protein
VEALCQEQGSRLSLEDVIGAIQAESEIEEQRKAQTRMKAQQDEAIQQVMVAVGDCFSEIAIREALIRTDWEPDQAQELLFQERHAVEVRVQPVINGKSLLDFCRVKNAIRKQQQSEHCDYTASESDDLEERHASSKASTVESESDSLQPSNEVKMIQDVFLEIQRKCLDLEQKNACAEKPVAESTRSQNHFPRRSQGKRKFVKFQS